MDEDDFPGIDTYVSQLRKELEMYVFLIEDRSNRGDFDGETRSLINETFRNLKTSSRDLRESIHLIENGPDRLDAMRTLCALVRNSFLIGCMITEKITDKNSFIDRISKLTEVARGERQVAKRSTHLDKAVKEEAEKFWKEKPSWLSEKKFNATAIRIIDAVNANTEAACRRHHIDHKNVKAGAIRKRLIALFSVDV